MTTAEFNEKYSDYLEEGHYGLALGKPEVVEYLDYIFSNLLIHIPDFEFAQIKAKFNYYCVYTSVPQEINSAIEKQIAKIYEQTEGT